MSAVSSSLPGFDVSPFASLGEAVDISEQLNGQDNVGKHFVLTRDLSGESSEHRAQRSSRSGWSSLFRPTSRLPEVQARVPA